MGPYLLKASALGYIQPQYNRMFIRPTNVTYAVSHGLDY